MKTAMQELIDHLNFIDLQDNSYKNIAILSTNNVRQFINGLKLLEKEKKQIIDAFEEGFSEGNSLIQTISPQDYYNETY